MIVPSTDIELDSGPRDGARERMCVATRAVRPVADLLRFVIGPNGEAVPDLKQKLPGRGVWVTATRDALGEAIKRKVFARGFKRGQEGGKGVESHRLNLQPGRARPEEILERK